MNNVIKNIIFKLSEIIMYAVSFLINEIHLDYFIYPITFILTFIGTFLIIHFLKYFGIHDNLENDVSILKKISIKKKSENEETLNDKNIKIKNE